MSKIFDGLQYADPLHSEEILSICGAFIGRPKINGTQKDPVPSLGVVPIANSTPISPISANHTEESAYQVLRAFPKGPILPFLTEPDDISGEQYRIARTKIAQHPSEPRMILIASVSPGDGKTTTSINIAAAFSLNTHRDTLLIDTDLRRGSVTSMLGLSQAKNTQSLVDLLAGRCSLEDAIVRVEQLPSLCVLQAGTPTDNPAELLASPEWVSLCGILKQRFRYIILDSPPMSALADYQLLQNLADGVVLAAMPDHTPRRALFRAIQTIPKQKLIGIVLNRIPQFFLFKSQENSYRYYTDHERSHGTDR